MNMDNSENIGIRGMWTLTEYTGETVEKNLETKTSRIIR
jgi:hypothetical protein